MRQQTIGDITASDIGDHQIRLQNKELFARLEEILTPDELAKLLLSALGMTDDELSQIPEN